MSRRFSRAILVLAVLVCALAAAAPVAARQADRPAEDAPPHFSVLEGRVSLEREGQVEPAALQAPLVAGDRVRTDDGRAEILLGDGSALYLDEGVTIDVLSESALRLMAGRVTLIVSAGSLRQTYRYQIDTPASAVRIDSAGEFRVAVRDMGGSSETDLRVVHGLAELASDRETMVVRASEWVVARGDGSLARVGFFNSARWDVFDRWVEDHRRGRAYATSSTDYRDLPPAVRVYAGVFRQYGSWDYVAPYGYVWYPRVSFGWRPYYRGRWSQIRVLGWTWIGLDPWGWPTHHFGRWGFSAGRWFWVPAGYWGPAWVSWASAPGFVAWCPLGVDGRPVMAFARGGTLGIYGANGVYDPWDGWTIMPRGEFGTGRDVPALAVNARVMDHRARAAFAVQASGPAPRGTAGPRSTSVAVPRANTQVEPRSRVPASREVVDVDRRRDGVAERTWLRDDRRAVPRAPAASGLSSEPQRERVAAPTVRTERYPSAPREDGTRAGVTPRAAPRIDRQDPNVLFRGRPAPRAEPRDVMPPQRSDPSPGRAVPRSMPDRRSGAGAISTGGGSPPPATPPAQATPPPSRRPPDAGTAVPRPRGRER